MKLVLIGGVSFKDTDNPRVGGTTVLMDNFCEYCQEHQIPFCFIPTNFFLGRLKHFRNTVFLLHHFFKNTRKGDMVMVNISSKAGIVTLYPLIVIISNLIGAKTVCRKFAGSVHKYLETSNLRKTIAFYFLKKSKVNYFETQELINYFKNNDVPCAWFPNVRKPHNYRVSRQFNKKFVYISQIYQDKGIDILLEISKQLPEDYTIDIYGPIIDNKYNEKYFENFPVSYKGVLLPDQVISTLSSYNVMLFPTYWHSEGYPGVIIEAISVGMPVISTNIGGIPELVENGVTGMIVESKNSKEFYNAIMSIDSVKYLEYVNATMEKYNDYNSDIINCKVIKEIMG